MSVAAAPAVSGPALAGTASARVSARAARRRMEMVRGERVSSVHPTRRRINATRGLTPPARLPILSRSLREREAGDLLVVADEDALVGERRVVPHHLAAERAVVRVDQ